MTELHYRILKVLQTVQFLDKTLLLNAFYERIFNRNVSIEPWTVERALHDLEQRGYIQTRSLRGRPVCGLTASGKLALSMTQLADGMTLPGN